MDVNSYILVKENQALVIDPGFNGEAILNHCKNHNVQITHCVFTHGHYDHIKDLESILRFSKPKIYIFNEEIDFLYNPNLNLSSMFKEDFVLDKSFEVVKIEDNQIIDFMNEKIKVIHLPGHTKGSIGLIYNRHFFSGDTLFYDSVGRTDLPTGNGGKMLSSLKKIKSSLAKNTIVYPGHGKGGPLSEILLENPYLNNLK